MSKVINESFVNLQGWMLNELNLKGNDLVIYAIIYGFSQTEGQYFTGSVQYLADWTNSTKQGVFKNLKSLMSKGYIDKKEVYVNGVKLCKYKAIIPNRGSKQSLPPVNKVDGGSKQSLPGVVNKVDGGGKQSLPNNIINNIDNNIDNSIGEKKHTRTQSSNNSKIKKLKYGKYQNVLLTEEQYNDITKEWGEEKRDKAIIILDVQIETKGYKSNNHYATIIDGWVKDKLNELEQKQVNDKPINQFNNFTQRKYSKEDLEKLEKRKLGVKEEEQPIIENFEERRNELQARLKDKYKKSAY